MREVISNISIILRSFCRDDKSDVSYLAMSRPVVVYRFL